MKIQNIFTAAALSFALLTSTSASALLIGSVTQGGNTTTVTDGDAADTEAATGVLSFGGATVGFEAGSFITDPSDLHLNALYIGTGTASFSLTQTDITSDPTTWTLGLGGFGAVGTVVEAWASFDNIAFGQGVLIGTFTSTSPAFSFSSEGLNIDVNGPYSVSLFTTISHGNSFASTSVDASANVPEPSIVALLGLGLVGMGFATRRKQKAA